MIRPSMQFYPRDWLAHPGLRMCSLQARGLWIDMMSLMHSGEPYGYLTHKGKDILPPVLARIVGASIAEIEALLAELKEHGVVSQAEDGRLYSGRMVRDEELRQVRAAGGVKSLDNPKVARPKKPGKDTPKDILPNESDPSFRPSPAVAVASASSSKKTPRSANAGIPSGFDVLSKSDCDRLFEKWSKDVGTILYSRLRKAYLAILASEAGRAFTVEEFLNATEAFGEWRKEQDDKDLRFINIEKDYAERIHHWVRLGKMPISHLGELTERGAIIGTKKVRRAS